MGEARRRKLLGLPLRKIKSPIIKEEKQKSMDSIFLPKGKGFEFFLFGLLMNNRLKLK